MTWVFDGVTDDTAAIQAALNANTVVELPEGTAIISSLSIVSNGQVLRGKGRHATKLIVNNSSSIGINVDPSLAGIELGGFTLGRNVAAVSGGNGISTLDGPTAQANVHDILCTGHFRGLTLGPTDWSVLENIISEKNTFDGIYGTNSTSLGIWQWTINHCLSQKNGGRGLLVESTAGPSGLTMGTINGLDTFANSGVDIAFVGSAGTPINGVRMNGCFNGASGNHSLYFDTYGRMHEIADFFIELTGHTATGPTMSTPPSLIGNGIWVSANNKDILFNGGIVSQTSHSGMSLSAGEQELAGVRVVDCGMALTSGQRAGIRHLAGKLQMVGGRSGNSPSLTTQQYGVHGYNGAKAKIIGCDLENNVTAISTFTTGAGYFAGCFP